ncbi:hypothetical protein AA958_32690 [Streptomyces sp. CNQ-509]|nr:hypothetical protein AA958_32690 [Streptomyces sp. CNQ-509]
MLAASRRAASRLFGPCTAITARRLCATLVRTPTVTPCRGTSVRSEKPGKVFMLSARVVSASAVIRLPESAAVPGGLNATCPSDAPEASRNRSTPPASASLASYAAGSCGDGNHTASAGIERPWPAAALSGPAISSAAKRWQLKCAAWSTSRKPPPGAGSTYSSIIAIATWRRSGPRAAVSRASAR